MKTDRLYFKNLDSIRFFAAMMVFLTHSMSMAYSHWGIDGTFLLKALRAISSGGTGVSIFFVLSGFLISYLLISEYEEVGHISIKNFYIRRVLRIWPLYYAVVIFSFFIYPYFKSIIGISDHSMSNVFYYLTFLSNFDVIHVEKHFTGQDVASQNITWSVSVEEQFYLFWPLLFAFLPKRSWVYAISLVIIGSFAFRLLHYNDPSVLYFSTFSVLIDLGIGGLMAYAIKHNSIIRNFFTSASTTTHLILFCLFFFLLLWNDRIFSFGYGVAVQRVFLATSYALIIAAQAMTQKSSALNLGNLAFANKWGKYTYGIYLMHPIVISFLTVLVRLLHLSVYSFWPSLGFGALAFGLTLSMSWVSYNFFESKFLALKHKFEVIRTAR